MFRVRRAWGKQMTNHRLGIMVGSMAKPDRSNFSLPVRIVLGVIALVVIVALLAFLGYIH